MTSFCKYCRKPFETEEGAKECYIKHDILYVPLASSDLLNILSFFTTKESALITESCYRAFDKLRRRAVTGDTSN